MKEVEQAADMKRYVGNGRLAQIGQAAQGEHIPKLKALKIIPGASLMIIN